MATSAEKQTCLNGYLPQGVVMLHLDARRPGVKVPDYIKNQEWLRLNFNHAKGKGDLVVNEWGIRETLRFNGAWFPVSIPWSAVFGLQQNKAGQQPVIFAEDLPEEMVEQALAWLQREGYSLEELELNRPQSLWPDRRANPAQVPLPAPVAAVEVPPQETPREIRRGHLRLVK